MTQGGFQVIGYYFGENLAYYITQKLGWKPIESSNISFLGTKVKKVVSRAFNIVLDVL